MIEVNKVNKINLNIIKKLLIIIIAFLLLFSVTNLTNIFDLSNESEKPHNPIFIEKSNDLSIINEQKLSLNAGPDLVIDSVSIPSGPITYNESFPYNTWIAFTIKNVGTQPINNTYIIGDLVNVTKDGKPYSIGGNFNISSFLVPLNPGDTAVHSFAIAHKSIWGPGFYSLFLRVDAWDEVMEENESNNISPEISFYIGNPEVDLVVSNIDIVSSTIYYEIEPFTSVTFTVRNIGVYPLNNTHLIADLVNVTKDAVSYSPGGFFNLTGFPAPLFPGESFSYSFFVGHDTTWPIGEYHIRVRVDAWNDVNESIEDNNLSPELQFSVVDVSSFRPIYIDSDDDFSRFGYPGQGTQEDPYIIAGLYITDNSVPLVQIFNTSVHFVIKDSLLDGIDGSYDGIYLENVKNAKIEVTEVKNSYTGIKIVNSFNIVLDLNDINYCLADGIAIIDSEEFKITESVVRDNGFGQLAGTASINEFTGFLGSGIYLDPSSYGLISGNKIVENALNGINLLLTTEISITENDLAGNGQHGIALVDSSFNEIIGNSIYGNGYTEIVLASSNGMTGFLGSGIYLDPSEGNHVSDNTIYNNANSGVHLFLTDDSEVVYNNIYENGQNGIFLEDSTGNLIAHNNVKRNGLPTELASTNELNGFLGSGIYLDPSGGNVVEFNIVEGNVYGIFLEASSGNTFEGNLFLENDLYGLYFDETSENNTAFQNDFIRNHVGGESQAYDDGKENNFSNNYWSDHDDPTNPYPIDGKANNEDPEPASEPFVYLTTSSSKPPSSNTITTTPGLTIISIIGFVGVGMVYLRRKKD